jgi:hypothetical protein
VFGQFDGYESEDGVAAGSSTETFVAVRAEIDNDRSRGVALLLRTGEAMAEAGASSASSCASPSARSSCAAVRARGADSVRTTVAAALRHGQLGPAGRRRARRRYGLAPAGNA